jgi:uncharacterized membrane protein YedE/YeeE
MVRSAGLSLFWCCRENTMLVMFLTASATSALSIALMKTLSPSSKAACDKAGDKYMHSKTQGIVAVGVGGILIGMGMAIAGTCPGTIWAQLGAGQPKTLITFGGALVGAAIIALAHKVLDPVTRIFSPNNRTLDAILGVSPLVSGLVLTAAFGLVVLIVLLVPGVYSPLPGAAQWFGTPYWHPLIGGLLVGLVQVPLTLGVKKNLGASTSFSVIVASLFRGVGYVNDHTRPLLGGANWWNVVFVVLATLGATIGAWSGNSWYSWDQMASVSEWEAFVGGILLLLGSRFASGCTSGHGITGVGHGSLLSMVGVAGIFAGGMLVAFPRQALMH